MIFGKCIGVAFEGTTLKLALLKRRLQKYQVADLLTLYDYQQTPLEEAQGQVGAFLRKNRASHCRCVLSIPRSELILRQIELPLEAVPNLAKVVEYQVAGLVPSEDTSIVYDFIVSKGAEGAKSVLVTIFLAMKSVVDRYLDFCSKVGLRIVRITASNVALADFFLSRQRKFRTPTAVVGTFLERRLELVGLQDKAFRLSRGISETGDENATELLERELEVFRCQMGIPENQTLKAFLVGFPEHETLAFESKPFSVQPLSRASAFGLLISRAEFEGQRLQDHFGATAAACQGFRRKPLLPINLLPPEKRVRKSRWILVPTYVLAGVNLVLGLALILRSPIQQKRYSQQLSREILRLEPEVRTIRNVEKQIDDLHRRAELLSGFRKTHSNILNALNELSRLLPKNSWVTDFTLKNREIEFQGMSDAAASLPQILDNSPFFKGAEFVGSITRDGTGKEIYRIRMRLEGPMISTLVSKPIASSR